MKNIALIGCGGWGKNIARALDSLGILHTLCDSDSKLTSELIKQYPIAKVVKDLDAVLSDPEIQGVIIATPSVTHFSIARKVLSSGKDVLVEKPMAMSVDEGSLLVQEAKKLDRILMVGHVLEYHPAILKLKELIGAGALGKIHTIQSNRLNFGKIRTEENSLWSFAPHDIAIILRLIGEDPHLVSCHGGAFLNKVTADSTLTYLNFPSGAQAHIFVSWLHPFKEHKLIVVGSRQMAVFNDLLPWEQKLVLYPHCVNWVNGKTPIASPSEALNVELNKEEPLRVECEQFSRAIQSRVAPLTDGESGVRVIQVLNSAQRSLDQNGTPEKISKNINPVFIHPTARVDMDTMIGEGTKVWHFSHVMAGAKIGKKCILGQNVHISRNAILGNGVKVQNNVSVYEGVILEDNVFCGPSMVFTNVMNPRSHIERKKEFRKTLVRMGATLGANCTVVCGNTIGRFAFVGAGSVVTKNVPNYALVVGSPAKWIGWVCSCGVKLSFNESSELFCDSCSKIYHIGEDGLQETDLILTHVFNETVVPKHLSDVTNN